MLTIRTDNELLKAALREGPVSVYIDGEAIRHYKSGIFNDKCKEGVTHAITAVGFVRDSKTG